jgi:hypothetical protein
MAKVSISAARTYREPVYQKLEPVLTVIGCRNIEFLEPYRTEQHTIVITLEHFGANADQAKRLLADLYAGFLPEVHINVTEERQW